ncbi:hypothetical protein N6H14_29530 [Paenibacillus sp. CC-CFT747]|nr:hypothetical protein N6H14_29530 [Paenibacillus sp. CC-CFT747]
MNRVIRGEAVPLLKKAASLTVDYKEMLRLFYVLHSENARIMSRMQALIELNTGKDLAGQATYVQASGESSIKLWFLPGIARSLNRTGILPCQVRDGRCQFTGTAVMSY